jgi:plastocyanin
MNTTKLIAAMAVSAALGLGPVAFAAEHEEESIDSSKVPTAVQQAAEKEASGGKIVRWEKEGKAYEAVIEKDGKQWGYRFDKDGNLKGKHDESKEKGEKEEH